VTLRHTFGERLPIQMGFATAGESNKVDEYGKRATFVVVWRQIDADFSSRWIP